ncbi:MAG: tetratricopeptide repeat protein [Myxococcota bacterium]
MLRFLFVLAVLFVPWRTQAQPTEEGTETTPTTREAPSTRANDELAQKLADPATTGAEAYEIGVREFERARYGDAELAWVRSNELDPNPILWIAIADTREQRDDEPGTVKALERYLSERPDAPDRTAVEARIATLQKTPAEVTVRSIEAGHAILLDGKPLDQKTPATIEMEPGEHTVIVVGNGVEVGEQTFQVGYGEARELVFTPKTPSHVEVQEAGPDLDFEAEVKASKRAVWALTGVAGAALVTGTALGVTALRKEQDFRDDPTAETADKGNRLALFADVSFGIAALSAVTALAIFLTTKNKKKRRERQQARVRFETRGPGAAATLRF